MTISMRMEICKSNIWANSDSWMFMFGGCGPTDMEHS